MLLAIESHNMNHSRLQFTNKHEDSRANQAELWMSSNNNQIENQKTHFAFKSESNQVLVQPWNLINRSYEDLKNKTLNKFNEINNKNISDVKSSISAIMKQKNIVYGYERNSPYFTSSQFYTTSNHSAFAEQITPEMRQKQRKASFEFGNNITDYFTSNKMQTIKINKDENISKCIGGNKSSPKVNISHIQIAQKIKPTLVDLTTYNESLGLRENNNLI